VPAQVQLDATAEACIATRARRGGDSGRLSGAEAPGGFIVPVRRCLATMHAGMDRALSSNAANADRAFAAAMDAHHLGAIDMAREYLVSGRDPALRSMAMSIVADQQAERALLRAWLKGAAESAPTPAAVSPNDRVYTADQVSNTVSVIAPSSNRLLGVIRLGNRRPDLLSPLYKGQINVHGLGVSPDGHTLAVISTGSNGVTLTETTTNRILGTVYVGRNPHEGFFTPDGRELWIAVRGEDHVAVIDPAAMRVTRRIVTAPGPGMVVFRPDGRVAFVAHSFTPELDVVDVASHRVLRRIPVTSPFSPNLAATADGAQVWLTHKDVGKVTVVNARTFEVEGVIDTGPVTSHVTFAGAGGGTRTSGAVAGDFAYVTVGGENAVKVYRRDRSPVATIPMGSVPHGVWASGDGARVYVGLQQADSVAVLDTRTNQRIATIPTGQSPQAVLYVVNAVPSGAGTANLAPLLSSTPVRNVVLAPVDGNIGKASVSVRSLGPVDGVDVSATDLRPSSEYTLFLTSDSGTWPLATVRADSTGKVNAEAVAPIAIRDAPGAQRLVLVLGHSMDSGAVLAAHLEP